MSSSLWIPNWAPLKPEEALKLRVGSTWRSGKASAGALCINHWPNQGLFAQGTQGPTGFQGLTSTAPKVSQGIVPCEVCLEQ